MCAPSGATRATLSGAAPPTFVPGDLLLFEEIAGASSGAQADQDRSHRHVVRLTEVTPDTDPLDATPVVEVAWAAEDAMPFDFRVSALTTASDGTATIGHRCGARERRAGRARCADRSRCR